MDCLHFNGFYKSYLQALKIKNIYKYKFKYNKLGLNILYLFSFLMLICSFILVMYASLKNLFIFLGVFMAAIFLFGFLDRKCLKRAVKVFRKKHKVKLIFPDLFDQFKYYLWKDELDDAYSLFSVDKALNYLEIELSKFNIEKIDNNPLYMTILSTVTIIAFWKFIDDAHFSQYTKIMIDGLLGYASYRFITFKFYILEDKQKKLLVFKQFLLRLKSENRSN